MDNCVELHIFDVVGIVEQLEQECAVISSMLKDVVTIETATGASTEATGKHWTPALVSTGRLNSGQCMCSQASKHAG